MCQWAAGALDPDWLSVCSFSAVCRAPGSVIADSFYLTFFFLVIFNRWGSPKAHRCLPPHWWSHPGPATSQSVQLCPQWPAPTPFPRRTRWSCFFPPFPPPPCALGRPSSSVPERVGMPACSAVRLPRGMPSGLYAQCRHPRRDRLVPELPPRLPVAASGVCSTAAACLLPIGDSHRVWVCPGSCLLPGVASPAEPAAPSGLPPHFSDPGSATRMPRTGHLASTDIDWTPGAPLINKQTADLFG